MWDLGWLQGLFQYITYNMQYHPFLNPVLEALTHHFNYRANFAIIHHTRHWGLIKGGGTRPVQISLTTEGSYGQKCNSSYWVDGTVLLTAPLPQTIYRIKKLSILLYTIL